jgi:hypothetical protein
MNTTIFSNLTKQFPTSAELFAWLQTAEGGSLKVVDNDPFAMIFYDRATSDMTAPHVEYFRSVVWDKAENKPVCVGPSRGLSFGAAIAHGLTEFKAEEFVDGVMINLFYNPYNSAWQLATRTQFGAGGHFYGKRSFAALFWETFASKALTTDLLVPGEYYSWVLQHPDERVIVAPLYGIPTLTLVGASSDEARNRFKAFWPTTYSLKSLDEVKEFVTVEGQRLGHAWQGVVIHGSDHMYKFRTAEYEAARILRGNQPKRPFLWLERWGQGTLMSYLRMFPEEQHDADQVITEFKACTQELHNLYLEVYRKKTMPLGQAPQKYRKLIWEAHKVGKGAYFPHLRQFMNEQATARKLWLVNYDMRYGVITKGPAFTKGPEPVPEPDYECVD